MFSNLDLLVTNSGQVAEEWNSIDLTEYLREQMKAKIKPGTAEELRTYIRELARTDPGLAIKTTKVSEAKAGGPTVVANARTNPGTTQTRHL